MTKDEATNKDSLLVQSAQEAQQESNYAGRKLTALDEFLDWNRENETKMYVSIASEYHVFEKALEIAIKHNLLPFTAQPAQEPASLGDFDKKTKTECVKYIEYLREEIDLLRAKQWVGLSVAEIGNISFKHGMYANDILQKTKEKNT